MLAFLPEQLILLSFLQTRMFLIHLCSWRIFSLAIRFWVDSYFCYYIGDVFHCLLDSKSFAEWSLVFKWWSPNIYVSLSHFSLWFYTVWLWCAKHSFLWLLVLFFCCYTISGFLCSKFKFTKIEKQSKKATYCHPEFPFNFPLLTIIISSLPLIL